MKKIFGNKRGQVIALTIFIVLLSLGMVLIFFMPINQQVIRLRKILVSFQSLANSESGIEFALAHAMGRGNLGNFQIGISSTTFSNSGCYPFAEKIGDTDFDTCYYIRMTTSSNIMNMEIYNSIKTLGIMRFYTKIFSVGEYRNIQRMLDFDYLP
jgi:hypothetical protein